MTFKTFYLFLFLPVLFITGCSDNTVSSDSSVSGRFIDESGQAVEGALVRVFAVKPLDTLVTRLRKEYKDVGCDISDATEFDHRFYGKPLAEGKTKSDGSFSIEGLSGGPYHISITHPQYSWRYIYRTSGGNLNTITTLPVIEIKGILTGDNVWERKGQDYIVTGNAVQNGGSLTIKSGVRIRLGSQRSLVAQESQVIMQGDLKSPVWVTSDTDSSYTNFYNGLKIVNSNTNIEYSVFSGGVNSLSLVSSIGIVQNTYFAHNLTGCQVNQSTDEMKILCIVAYANIQNSIVCETYTGALEDIISFNSNDGILCGNSSVISISNSYLHGLASGLIIDGNSKISTSYSDIYGQIGVMIIGAEGNFILSNIAGNPAALVRDRSSGGAERSIRSSRTNFFFQNTALELLVKTQCNFEDCYFMGLKLEELKHFINTSTTYEQLGQESAKFLNVQPVRITVAGMKRR